jgi:hypothetical protein
MLAVIMSSPSVASERLIFKKDALGGLGASTRLIFPEYVTNVLGTSVEDLEIAAADLNQDGIDEFIAKPLNCNKNLDLCPHYILAETSKGVISLGTIPAKAILLGQDSYHGIRSLMVFSDTKNDFAYNIFVWNPSTSSFKLKGSPS